MAAPASSPRIRVAAVIPDEEGLVLVRHRKDGEIYDLLPGGGVEWGESLEEALKREVLEETGLTCDVRHPLFINDTIAPDGSRHVVQITFLATRTGGEIDMDPSDERVMAAHFVPVSLLAYLDLRPPMAQQLLAASTAGYPVTAQYLGALWTDDARGITETEQHP